MDDFFFVKIEGLEPATDSTYRPLLEIAQPWIRDEVFLWLCATTAGHGTSLVAITADKLYFMDIVPGDEVSRLKCFHKRGMVAHALIAGSDKELPQIRIMMDNALKLQFQMAERNRQTDEFIKAASACEFFN